MKSFRSFNESDTRKNSHYADDNGGKKNFASKKEMRSKLRNLKRTGSESGKIQKEEAVVESDTRKHDDDNSKKTFKKNDRSKFRNLKRFGTQSGKVQKEEVVAPVNKGAVHMWLNKSPDEPITTADVRKSLTATVNMREEAELLEAVSRFSPKEAHDLLTKHDAHQDFFTLSSSQVSGLLGDAKGYRKGRNAPGSTGRMFHQFLRRVAEKHPQNEETLLEYQSTSSHPELLKTHMLAHEKTGKEIKIGSKVKGFRGTYHIKGFEMPHHSGSTGRVIVHDKRGAFGQSQYFPGVVDAKIVKRPAVKEDVEQVDELSKKTLASYIDNAVMGHKGSLHNTSFRAGEEMAKSPKGTFNRASQQNFMKSAKRYAGVKKALNKLTKEENLGELSAKTMGDYVHGASVDLANHATKVGKYFGSDHPERKKAQTKVDKRIVGITKATKKIRSEEVEAVDEISTKKLANYMSGAASDMASTAFKRGQISGHAIHGDGKYEGEKELIQKGDKRVRGIAKAAFRLSYPEMYSRMLRKKK